MSGKNKIVQNRLRRKVSVGALLPGQLENVIGVEEEMCETREARQTAEKGDMVQVHPCKALYDTKRSQSWSDLLGFCL